MTEKELYSYIKAKERCERIEQEINVLYTRIHSPRSVCYGMPTSSKAPGEWLANAESRLEDLRKLYRKVYNEQSERYMMLLDVSAELEREIEEELFWLLYHDNKSIEEARRKINYSMGSMYRLRKSILKQAKGLKVYRDDKGRLHIEKEG